VSYFTTEEKRHFKKFGFVAKENVIPEDIRSRAIDVLWETIEADRDQPESWIDAGLKGNLPCNKHDDIGATVHHTAVYEMAEELTGPGTLRDPSNPLCKMIYPTGHENWEPPHGHLDGLTDPIQVECDEDTEHDDEQLGQQPPNGLSRTRHSSVLIRNRLKWRPSSAQPNLAALHPLDGSAVEPLE